MIKTKESNDLNTIPSSKKSGLIIFDLDGTLYELRGGSFLKSPLKKKININVKKYLAANLNCSLIKATRILGDIEKKYGEDISIGIEKEFGLDRYDYFNNVWNIPAKGVVKKAASPRAALLKLRRKYKLILLSDAPAVWIHNVLVELKLDDVFKGAVFSGEGNRRKGFGNAFMAVAKTLKFKPKNCITVGDQERTDIIPAKELGMKAVFVHSQKKSEVADVNIKNIADVYSAIVDLNSKK